ncbi:MAG: type II secretion system secretin GspD [Geminicoccales bacterium]
MVNARVLTIGLAGILAGCSGDPSAPDQASATAYPTAPILSKKTLESGGAEIEPRRLFATEIASEEPDRLTEPVVERGTGRVIGQPRSSAAPGVNRNEAGDLTLNVVDADIRDVVRLVLEDGLNANYVIDPAVTGTITIRTSRPIPADDVTSMLNSVLNLNGASLIQQDGLYKVLPSDQAITAGGRPGTRTSAVAGRAGAGIQVAPIRHADAAQLAELLQPFTANQGSVQVDASRNTLLILGSADQNATINELIDMFDVDWMAGMSFGLYPLKAVGSTQLVSELDQVFGDPDTGVAAGALRFVPLDRLNALLAIAAQPDHLDRVEDWIERLDKVGDGEGEQVYVYAVQNGRAGDLAVVLGELFDIESTAIGQDSLLAPGLEPVELRSSLPTFDNEDRGGEGALQGDVGAEPFRDRRSSSGPGRLAQRSLTHGREDNTTRIVADETSNSLLVRSSAKEYRQILSALRELDKQPLQVLLEATIAEVSLQDELSYGIQWFFGSGESGVTFSDVDDGGGLLSEVFPGFSGLLSRGDARVVINALDSVSDVKVISSPQILVLDNQTALLQVGDEVPIVTQQAEGIDTGDARIVNTVEQRQTGVVLSVTPRVNSNGLVVLDIEQEVSDVVLTTTSGIDSPTIAQRRIDTSVAVGSDQTIALGGLIQDDVEEVRSGIPFLHDLPFIGPLFGNTTTLNSRTELLVLITPKVLTNQQEAIAATDELRQRLRAIEPLEAKLRKVRAGTGRLSVEQPRSDHVVQLASLPSEDDAWNAWTAYEQDYKQDFLGLEPRVERVENGERTFYRLQVGSFQDAVAAYELCSTITARGDDCLVVQKRSS